MTHYRAYEINARQALQTSFGAHCQACHKETQHYMKPLERGNIYDCFAESRQPYNGETSFIVRNQCTLCGHISYDLAQQTDGEIRFTRIHPIGIPEHIPTPNTDLPEHILRTYQEAAHVCPHSPRAAAALLRYALQQILQDLRIPGNSINEQIAALHKEGIDPRLISLMDTCRVIGNNAAHTGEIIFSDTLSIARTLFLFINEIAARTYTLQRARNEIATQIPEDMVQLINKRQQK